VLMLYYHDVSLSKLGSVNINSAVIVL